MFNVVQEFVSLPLMCFVECVKLSPHTSTCNDDDDDDDDEVDE